MKQPLQFLQKLKTLIVNWTLRNVKDNPTLKNAKSVYCRKYFKKHRNNWKKQLSFLDLYTSYINY